MRVFSKVSSQDFVLIKILSHTLHQVGIWQAYTLYDLVVRYNIAVRNDV